MAEPGVPVPTPEVDTEPIEIPLDTRRYVEKRIAATSSVRPIDIAHAVREAERLRKLEEEIRRTEDRAAHSWIQRKWKKVAAWASGIAAAIGVAYRALIWIEESAEARVLQRQADEKQATAVEDNAKAVRVLNATVEGNTEKIGDLEEKMLRAEDLQRLQLELQLANPTTKRALAQDQELKKKVERLAPAASPPD